MPRPLHENKGSRAGALAKAPAELPLDAIAAQEQVQLIVCCLLVAYVELQPRRANLDAVADVQAALVGDTHHLPDQEVFVLLGSIGVGGGGGGGDGSARSRLRVDRHANQ